ncbi:CHD3-type chromatin-remodeling factor pickle-like protein [Trifolium pratense]|uniref:CHD3-type chromatin-remodeling factor pickle-like protein n=1 Tax=Trifolium pratense TaxID=57577 RepID=A0A2K3P0Y7_TRIPR|nr:CHD3-type chromatin-remodeling factor pickle-like protein [Trifolium pratense]
MSQIRNPAHLVAPSISHHHGWVGGIWPIDQSEVDLLSSGSEALHQELVYMLGLILFHGGQRNKPWWHIPVQRQSIEALPTLSAEILWLQSLLTELECKFYTPKILCDNMGTVSLASNPTLHHRTKHLEIDIFFVREKVLSKSLVVSHVPAQDQWADVLTRPLSAIRSSTLHDKFRVFDKQSLVKPASDSKGEYLTDNTTSASTSTTSRVTFTSTRPSTATIILKSSMIFLCSDMTGSKRKIGIGRSDWNPHADLQAMARAHRLGQTNKVLIYRLITRGTIEERMMQMTKKKMVLEHLVVGRLKAQNINQEELDDIIRYGSKELFADENDEAGKSRQIHYDAAAIDRLLDRDQVVDEETTLDDEDEDGFLKAFKVANFEYVDEAEAAAEEEAAQKRAMETVNSSERTHYWEELLKDKFQEHKVEEFNALGKGKRNRKLAGLGLFIQLTLVMVSVEEDDLAGLEDVSSDEDDNYEAELTDGDSNSTGTTTSRRPYKKKARTDSTEPLPLMEGEGKAFRVLGFNQNQRAAFVQILMRFGVGDFDWKEFTSRMKQKTYEEIKEY